MIPPPFISFIKKQEKWSGVGSLNGRLGAQIFSLKLREYLYHIISRKEEAE